MSPYLVGFPLTLRLSLDIFPGFPVSSVAPFVSADSTDEETCNLLIGFLNKLLIFWTIWPLIKGRCSLLALATFAFALWFRNKALAGTWKPAASQQLSFDSPPSCGHTRRTRNNHHQTSLTCSPLSFPFPPFLPPLVLARASTSMGDAPEPCTFACRIFSIVSL